MEDGTGGERVGKSAPSRQRLEQSPCGLREHGHMKNLLKASVTEVKSENECSLSGPGEVGGARPGGYW